MIDKFEKYIRENKDVFDDQKADKNKLWMNIQKGLENPESTTPTVPIRKFTLLKLAAGFVFLIGLAAILFFYAGKQRTKQIDVVYYHELRDTDTYYQNLVEQQIKLVKNHPYLSDDDKYEFLSFLDTLDVEYQDLISELKKDINNEKVLEAIVKNYKKRIQLIEAFLQRVNNTKKIRENENVYIL
ncbi:hypothetical protein [Abyssalbus ytuae]|uniref:Anti-sigma factor n=1 Tax=Abyssalbus ytuae TaxID=2926907 RepID=A0A9E7D1L5_9FLAO|nr:hypothetical protein [Abyssalbus ytuae]UOB17243.1 hypothetical protein MQE35_16090 [Abyssalbus ytuae]